MNEFLTPTQVGQARELLKRGASLSLVAQRLNCFTQTLDLYLWHFIGEKITLRPEAMF